MDFQQGLITTIHEYGVTNDLLEELNRSLKKRPDYKEYMDKTPQLLFWFVKD